MKRLRLLLTVLCVLLCWPLFANAMFTLPDAIGTGNIEPQLMALLAGMAIHYVMKWLGKAIGRDALPGDNASAMKSAIPVEPTASAPQQVNAEGGERSSGHGPDSY